MTTNFGEVLKSFVHEIELIQVQIDGHKSDIKAIYASAKEAEINVKALKKIIAERRQDKAKMAALEETLDQYRHALGMLADLPLGKAAVQKYQDESGLTVVVKGAGPAV